MEPNRKRRYHLVSKSPVDFQADFANAVREGLTSVAKYLPFRYFYDALGSKLFQAICELPEYYVTGAERQILTNRAAEIAARIPLGVTLVELGSGNSDKTRLLIDALLARSGQLKYVPIDISGQALQESAEQLMARYADLNIVAICAEYDDAFAELGRAASHPLLMTWLGSSIGNFNHDQAISLLQKMKRPMSGDDWLLVGCDLRKDRGILEPAYDDALGVTAAFNLNLLVRINRELGANFDLSQFRHLARYAEAEGRVEMYIVSTCDQTVDIAALGMVVSFRRDERIHTENSYKYTPAQVSEMMQQAGFQLEQQWLDDDHRFLLNLAKPTASG